MENQATKNTDTEKGIIQPITTACPHCGGIITINIAPDPPTFNEVAQWLLNAPLITLRDLQAELVLHGVQFSLELLTEEVIENAIIPRTNIAY